MGAEKGPVTEFTVPDLETRQSMFDIIIKNPGFQGFLLNRGPFKNYLIGGALFFILFFIGFAGSNKKSLYVLAPLVSSIIFILFVFKFIKPVNVYQAYAAAIYLSFYAGAFSLSLMNIYAIKSRFWKIALASVIAFIYGLLSVLAADRVAPDFSVTLLLTFLGAMGAFYLSRRLFKLLVKESGFSGGLMRLVFFIIICAAFHCVVYIIAHIFNLYVLFYVDFKDFLILALMSGAVILPFFILTHFNVLEKKAKQKIRKDLNDESLRELRDDDKISS